MDRVFKSNFQCKMVESKNIPFCSFDEDEPDLIRNNQVKIGIFRAFGFFLLYWKNGKYEYSQSKLLLFYLLWYLAAIGCSALAFTLKEIFKKIDYKDRVDDLLEAAFAVVVIGIFPSAGIYLLREYSTNLPQILMITKKIENNKIYRNLKFAKESKISYMEGFLVADHNDDDDEEHRDTLKSLKQQWWLVKYVPFIGFVLSSAIIFILVLVSFFWDMSDLIITKSLYHLERELPCFIMMVVFPIPAFVSIWFCIFFLEWHRNIHVSVRYFIRNIKNLSSTRESTGHTMQNSTTSVISKGHTRLNSTTSVNSIDDTMLNSTTSVNDKGDTNSANSIGDTYSVNSIGDITLTEEHKQELEKLCSMLNNVQKVFILLNKKIFQKAIVKDFTLLIFLGVICCWKIIINVNNFIFIVPLSLSIGHVYLICKWSNDLMAEFAETIEVLNEINEGDIQDLRRELNECPPQVLSFGGFSVNYSMMTAVIAFILSIISISGMIWIDVYKPYREDQHCYEYQDNARGWNYTLCMKQHCYKYQDTEGIWNQTLCIKDEIENELFINETFCLRR